MTVVALIFVVMLISVTYKIAYIIVEYSSSLEKKDKCQICSTGIPYVLRYKEEVQRDTFCQYHRDQTYNIDELERNLLDTILIPLDEPGNSGRFRNTYIKPLPGIARVLTPNEIQEVTEMPYEEVTVWDTGEVVRKVYHDRPRAIAAPEEFSK